MAAIMMPPLSSQHQQADAGVAPVPFVPPPASGGMSDVVEMVDSTVHSGQLEPTDATEPSAKRQKLRVSRSSDEVMFHVDETEFGDVNGFDLTCNDDVETPFEKRIVTLIYKRKFSKVPFEKADALLRKSFS